MELFAPPVERLIEEFAKLPGIGQKTSFLFHKTYGMCRSICKKRMIIPK